MNDFLVNIELLFNNRLLWLLGSLDISILPLLPLRLLLLNLVFSFGKINLDLGGADIGIVEVGLGFCSLLWSFEAHETEPSVLSVFSSDSTVSDSAHFAERFGEFLGVECLGDIFDDKAAHSTTRS